MTNNKAHTPEPWKIDGGKGKRGERYIWLAGEYFGGHAIATVYNDMESADADAARIVACVNACEGINPEAVKEMLEALKDTAEMLESTPIANSPFGDKIRAALAKATGKKE